MAIQVYMKTLDAWWCNQKSLSTHQHSDSLFLSKFEAVIFCIFILYRVKIKKLSVCISGIYISESESLVHQKNHTIKVHLKQIFFCWKKNITIKLSIENEKNRAYYTDLGSFVCFHNSSELQRTKQNRYTVALVQLWIQLDEKLNLFIFKNQCLKSCIKPVYQFNTTMWQFWTQMERSD